MTPNVQPDLPPRLAVDADGFVWRVYDDDTWSMARINPDNSPIPQPVTFYEPVSAPAEAEAEVIDVNECPDCGQKGHYDGRVLIGGRGIYTCPDDHRWQDATETPSSKGIPISAPLAPHNPPKPANYHPYA